MVTRRTTFHRWVGGPKGHLEDLGTVTLERGSVLVFDPPSLHDLVSEPRYDRRPHAALSSVPVGDGRGVAGFEERGGGHVVTRVLRRGGAALLQRSRL